MARPVEIRDVDRHKLDAIVFFLFTYPSEARQRKIAGRKNESRQQKHPLFSFPSADFVFWPAHPSLWGFQCLLGPTFERIESTLLRDLANLHG